MPLWRWETDICNDFPVTYWAELQRIQIILFDIVKTIHKAPVINTVRDTEHMTNLMNHCSHWRIQYWIPIYLFSFSFSILLVPSEKRKYPYSSLVFSPPVHKVPIIPWIDIIQCDSHNTVSIFRYFLFHVSKNILC